MGDRWMTDGWKIMPKRIHITYTLLLLGCLMFAVPQGFSASKTPDKQQLFKMLHDGQHEAVRALASGERKILLGKLALDAGNIDQAIRILHDPVLEKDPLAALIRAEAYRRQSVNAAARAGHYAHSADGDINKLKNAKLSSALKRADQRLLAFTDSLNKPDRLNKPKQVKTRLSEKTVEVIVNKHTSKALLDDMRSSIEQWRKDWESLNADAYLSHYHPDFKTPKHTFTTWSAYKRRVNGRKSYIQVAISNLKAVGSPKQTQYGEAMLVEFDQSYQSSNYSANSRKRLYLVHSNDNGKWQILFEGDRTQAVTMLDRAQLAPNQPAAGQSRPSNSKWAINLGSFSSRSNADSMAAEINVPPGEKQPFVSTITSDNGQVQHRVRIGLFDTHNEAVNTMFDACPALGLTGCWLEQMK